MLLAHGHNGHRLKSLYVTIAHCWHNVAMTLAGCRSSAFKGIGVGWKRSLVVLGFFSSFNLFSAPALLSAGTSLSIFLQTLVAERGACSQPIHIEIQLDAGLLGGKPVCSLCAPVQWVVALPSPAHCWVLEPKLLLCFRSPLFFPFLFFFSSMKTRKMVSVMELL